MKLPRDLSGHELARLLRNYGYQEIRQTGSHQRLASTVRGTPHYITIPVHKVLKVGTFAAILSDVAAYLEIPRMQLEKELFES